MAKKSINHKRKHTRKSKHYSSKRRHYTGGATSASTYAMSVVGDTNTQFKNVFGPANNRQKHRGRGKTKKGGYWSQVISQAVVPFTLWGMQNRYRRNKTNKR